MNEPLLRICGLVKNFGRVEALRRVNFDLPAGRLTVFLGANGAGKTTTLKIILGFLFPDGGEVEKILPAWRIGYVPEEPAAFPWLKAKEILALTARVYGLSANEEEARVKELAATLSFDLSLLERRVKTYSHGNQKKFAYLQNLLIDPDLLVVDEPFAALDPAAIKQVRDLFLNYRVKQRTLLVSTHLISEAEKLVDRVVIIREGRTVLEADWPDFQKNYLRVAVKKESPAAALFQRRWPENQEREGFLENFIPRQEWEGFRANLSSVYQEAVVQECLLREPDLESVFLFYSPPPASQ
ncbi:MAG: ABC transporter ATP-binding protein [Candidatus Aminicenantales bacterium]